MYRKILIVPLFFAITGHTYCQPYDTTSLFSIGIKTHRSFIIQHTQKLSDQVTASNPWMVEADFNWHLRKPDTWQYCHCYPRTGVSLMYTNFDLPRVLGDAISVYAFIEPFIKPHRRLNYSIRFGMGPAFLTTLYDEETNPDNLFFSSPVSFIVLLNASANYRVTERLTFRVSANYNHISNGGYSEPNLGMNFPSISLGADYSFKDIRFNPMEHTLPSRSLSRKHRVGIHAGLSAKPVESGLREKRYPVYVLGANYSYAIARILALNGGVEWMSDRSVYHSLRKSGTVNGNGKYPDHSQAGVLMGIDWLFGRFIFYQHFGVYIYSPVKPMAKVYQRYGLNFMITDKFFAGLNIKAHGQDADFMDIRVGYVW